MHAALFVHLDTVVAASAYKHTRLEARGSTTWSKQVMIKFRDEKDARQTIVAL